jgi:DNA-binding IclR family transcriptional regulator
LEQNKETGKYKLGNEIFRLGTKVNTDIRNIASPYLSELVSRCQETVNLVVHDDCKVLYLKKVESPHSMRICTKDGEKLPMYCTAVGKAILAYLQDDEVNDILQRTEFVKFTDKTNTDRDILLQQLERVRQKGYAEDFEELEIGLVCVAAPIFNQHNKPIAGISVSGPTTRMTEKLRMEIAEILHKYTLEISKKLGY